MVVFIVFSGLDPAAVCNSSAIIKKIFPCLDRLKMDGGVMSDLSLTRIQSGKTCRHNSNIFQIFDR